MTSTKKYKKKPQDLRWGFSTGASMSALALCAWHFLKTKELINHVPVYFLDACERFVPVLSQHDIKHLIKKIPRFPKEITPFDGEFKRQSLSNQNAISSHAQSSHDKTSPIFALYKDGGDDPDCTHNALIYARLSQSSIEDAGINDYILSINKASLIIKCIEGIGISTRSGLDCEKGKWAITHGPRQMLIENLRRAHMHDKVWLLEIGVQRGEILAKHTLNPVLGVMNGISILGTTGLVRPYSHEAYLHTIEVCVKAHALTSHIESMQNAQAQNSQVRNTQAHKPHMVFCTGGRTKKGAELYLSHLPESAFTPIGDFIAESLKLACQYDMHTITVACMAGKLCKYAAGFMNTHAHKVQQDMDLLRAELRQCLPDSNAEFCHSLENASSVREALLFIPQETRILLLEQLSIKALQQFRSWCGARPSLQILVFNFDGSFLFQKHLDGHSDAKPQYELLDPNHNTHTADMSINTGYSNSKVIVTREYFLKKVKTETTQEDKA